jgi:hypothetical protein
VEGGFPMRQFLENTPDSETDIEVTSDPGRPDEVISADPVDED